MGSDQSIMSDSKKVVRYACDNGNCRLARDTDVTTYSTITECKLVCSESTDIKWYLGVFIVLIFTTIISVAIKKSFKDK